MPPIFVIGEARHGKTVFRKALAEHLGVRGASCSDVLYVVWSTLTGVAEEALRLVPKQEARPVLVALGDWLTTPAATYAEHFPGHLLPRADLALLEDGRLPKPGHGALIQWSLASGVRVLDGVRREAELDAAEGPLAWLGTPAEVVWVENPREGRVDGDNFSISRSRASWWVVNDGSVEELQEKARKIAEEILVKSKLDA